MATPKQVGPLYQKVMDDVMTNVRDAFLDEGVDEQILLELKQLWEKKLAATKALEHGPELETARSDQATRQTSQDRGSHSQKTQRQHGIPPVILAAAPPQPTQQTIPVSLIASQPELPGATTPAAAQPTVAAVPLGVSPQQLAALGAASQGGVSLQITADGQLVAVQNIGGQLIATAIPQQLVIRQEPVQTPTAAGDEQVTAAPADQHNQSSSPIIQLDGGGGGDGDGSSSSEEDDDFVDDTCDDNEEEQNEDEAEQEEAETPLNSEDDVSEEDSSEVFDTDNVVVCQYDKINRNKNKWKFNLKDGIMSLDGKDFVFQRANGDAEW